MLHFNASNHELGVVILLGSQNLSGEGLSHETSYTYKSSYCKYRHIDCCVLSCTPVHSQLCKISLILLHLKLSAQWGLHCYNHYEAVVWKQLISKVRVQSNILDFEVVSTLIWRIRTHGTLKDSYKGRYD